jgi:hypothetical protein
MARSQRAALGFSVHTGWACLVAVTGDVEAPRVALRRRVELLDGPDANAARFVYHLASEQELSAAKKLVERTTRAVRKTTLEGLRRALGELSDRGMNVVQAAILVGSAGPSGTLESILRSHATIHSAEGALYREAIFDACESLGIAALAISSRELANVAAAATGRTSASMEKHSGEAKRSVGAPWGQDQKQAMLAAWAALAQATNKRPSRSSKGPGTK